MFFTNEDYKIMKQNNWSTSYVENVLKEYALDYGLSFDEVCQIFQMYGVNELFDGVMIACEDFSEMFE